MTYSSGGPGYPGAQQPGAYAPTAEIAKADSGPSKLPVYLLIAVAVLGIAAYLLSFGPILKGDAGTSSGVTYGVMAALFAGLFAVVGLLPKQSNYMGVITATSVVGFLLTIYDLISHAKDAGWALIVIVIVSALQTVAAIAALLLDAGVISPPAPRPKYDPYQQFGGYYMPQGQSPVQSAGQQPQFGPPQPVAAQQPTTPVPQGYGQPQGFPSYGGYQGAQASGPFPAQPGSAPGGSAGFPGSPSTGGFAPQGHASGPPTPPTGFPTFAPPPSAPSPQPAAEPPAPPAAHEQPTQAVHIDPKPSESPAPPPA